MNTLADCRYEQLGLATLLAGRSLYRALPTGRLTSWVWPAIAHRHIRFAFDESGMPVAYWTWAWLAADVERRIIDRPNSLLHESEWNEGDHLWIIDFVSQRDYLQDVIHHIGFFQFTEAALMRSLRRRADGTLKKISTWALTSYRSRHSKGSSLVYRLPPSAFTDSRTTWLRDNQPI